MSETVRHQIWKLARDTPAILSALPDGEAGLLGDDDSPEPPAPHCPYLVLVMMSWVQSFSGSPNYRESGFQWWAYDYPHAGYTRIRSLLSALQALYPEYDSAGDHFRYIFTDTEGKEIIFWQRAVGLSQETRNDERSQVMQWAEWQTRTRFRGNWP